MTKAEAARRYGVNMQGTPLAVSGIYVRSDKGTFRHQFEEPMGLRDAEGFLADMTKGHDVRNAKLFSSHGHGYFTCEA